MPLNPTIHDWASKRVWVIGASTGIGAEIASELLARGARVMLSARSVEQLQHVAARASSSARVAPVDVTQPETLHAAMAELQQVWGGVDLVLIVAGTHEAMRAADWDLARARRLLEVNLFGVLHCVDAVLPTLLAQGAGGIAIVASAAGYIGLPKALVYGPSKAALINFAESLYVDLHPRGLGVYLINPGFVDTPLTRNNDFRMPALISAAEAAQQTLAGLAAGRFEIHYPRRFTTWLKLLRLLPYRLQFAAVRRFTGL